MNGLEAPNRKIELTIIVVNWNGGELLCRCVESVLVHPPSVAYEIVVADNASADGSMPLLQNWLRANGYAAAPVRLAENGANLGFGKANNRVIAQTDTPFVFLLNPDAEVTAGAIDALLEVLRADANVGACAPRLLGTDGKFQANVWRNPPTALMILFEGLQLYRLLPATLRANWLLGQHWLHDERRRVPCFSGAAMMVKRSMIKAIGAFDESFEMYGEDGEWCMRMVKHGWHLIFEPRAIVVHHGGQSAMKRWTEEERRLQEIDAWFRYQRFVLPPHRFISNTLAHGLVMSLLRLRRALRRQPSEYLNGVMQLQAKYLKAALKEMVKGGRALSERSLP